METNVKFEEIPLTLRETWKEYAEALATWEFLDDLTKTQKARLMNQWEGTESARERYAYSHPEYKKHLEDVKNARMNALRLKSYIDSLNALFELYRSKNAMKRAEMNLV